MLIKLCNLLKNSAFTVLSHYKNKVNLLFKVLISVISFDLITYYEYLSKDKEIKQNCAKPNILASVFTNFLTAFSKNSF